MHDVVAEFKRILEKVEESERTNTRSAGVDYDCRNFFRERGRELMAALRVPVIATHSHKKSGRECVIIGHAKMQTSDWRKSTGPENDPWKWFSTVDMSEVVVYREIKDGTMWVRPREEFEDGRFEPLAEEVS